MTFESITCPRKYQEDIDNFIRLNQRQSYNNPLWIGQRIFYIHGGIYGNDNMSEYGSFAHTIYYAKNLIIGKSRENIGSNRITIISNLHVKFSCELGMNLIMMLSEYDRVLQIPSVKTWIIDDDYKDILIMNFGNFEVRTRILSGLDDRQNYPSVDKEILRIDKKYPHFCVNSKCRKQLHLHDIIETNDGYTEDYLKELWLNPNIEFYCCTCYMIELMRKDNIFGK